MLLYNKMSKTTYLLSMDTLKTISQGALGAMTFGAYHQYTTNKIMELNNEKQDLLHKYLMESRVDSYWTGRVFEYLWHVIFTGNIHDVEYN